MKATAFKSLVAVAALASVGAAHAEDIFPPFLKSATGTWQLSVEALTGLSVSGSRIDAPAELPLALPGGGASNAASYTKSTGVASVGFSTVADNGVRVTSLQAPGSLLEIRRSVWSDEEDAVGQTKSVYLANIDLDLSASTIYADLYARDVTAGTALVSLGKQAIFTASVPGVVGGTEGYIVYSPDFQSVIASGRLAGELKFNQSAADIILSSLDISSAAAEGRLLRETSWGSFSFSSAVPEPSTYAMFAAGLLIAGALARRKAQS